jgi:tRNA dimethylallyltransferase
MDIGTAKPSTADRRRVNHHLIDVVEPSEEFSVACYLREAHRLVQELKARGRTVIFVGGTPMFLKGVLRGFDPGPPADWEFRQAVESDVERHGIEALRERLRQVDPLAEHRIGPNDTRRMIRALEVARHTGTPISHRQVQFDRERDPKSCNVFSLQWPRDELHARINDRVAQMFADGLVDEIRALLDQHGELSRTASQAVGYREVIDWIRAGGDLQQVVEEVSAHTRQLARRQETWLRSFSEIRSIDVQEPIDPEAVATRIYEMLS